MLTPPLVETKDSEVIMIDDKRYVKHIAPAGGLYLADIKYDSSHFKVNI